jgi:hypothetical protein
MRGVEKKLQTFCLNYFRKTATGFGLSLGEGVKVMADVTCLKDGNSFRMGIGFAETDLSFFTTVQLDKTHLQPTSYFRFMRVAKKSRDTVSIPFLIIELKRGGITSDTIRARTVVAQKIKHLFPFCSYLFIGDTTPKTKESVLRHGKDFNHYFLYKQAITENQLRTIDTQFVRPHLKNLRRMGLL